MYIYMSLYILCFESGESKTKSFYLKIKKIKKYFWIFLTLFLSA